MIERVVIEVDRLNLKGEIVRGRDVLRLLNYVVRKDQNMSVQLRRRNEGSVFREVENHNVPLRITT